MSILSTKLYAPQPRPKAVIRPSLIARLNEALDRTPGVTLISAPAGFGKTTLVSQWVSSCESKAAWLSLDEGDNDPARFLSYLVAALRRIADVGAATLSALQSPQPPSPESILTPLINELTELPSDLVLILDDYHVIDSKIVDGALALMVENLPPRMHVVIVTREDPQLPLARLRAQDRLTELRIADLRFTAPEAAEFLNTVMELNLSSEDIAALEKRTEGWIAGLQLAAISMRGHQDTAGFIRSFTGSHHFVMDYLVEEVLQQQSESIQNFLLHTSILDRLCGPLCDALSCDSSVSGQETLEQLERANLFIIALDNERRWYRYHHLFADLLRQRLKNSAAAQPDNWIAELHVRASEWYEKNGLEIEAFHHATAASDYGRAERLIEGKGMPLHFRGAVAPVLNWLETLPTTVLNAWPSLWTAFASTLLVTGHTTRVEPTLTAAEAALQNAVPNDRTRDLIGRIAATRATAAAGQHQVETIITESQRALEYLHSDNLAFRTSTTWKLGFAYHLQGNRTAAREAYREVISIGQASGNVVFSLMAAIGIGMLDEGDNQLHRAAETYRRVLQSVGETPLPFTCEAHHGLARVLYEWNELDTAQYHLEQGIELAHQLEKNDRVIACDILRARLKLARGDVNAAATILVNADRVARERNFVDRIPEIVAVQVLILIRQDDPVSAARLAEENNLPVSRARVHLAQRDYAAALSVLDPVRRELETRGWQDELLKLTFIKVLALSASGDKDRAVQQLSEALAVAEQNGFVRTFLDEGAPMARLLAETAARGVMCEYANRLLAIFRTDAEAQISKSPSVSKQPLIEPLSQRELEVLRLVAQGLSNREISERLFIALITVKGHNQRIFGKLQVQRRTEAVARARDLGLL